MSVETMEVFTKLPFLGTRRDRSEAATTGVAALLITVAYVAFARSLDTSTSWLEGASLWASLACVWLARTENIWNMPYGLVSVILLGWYLLDVKLVGQGWLQYVYYVPIQMVGWWAWARGGVGRTELPISRLTARGWVVVSAATLTLWAACWVLFRVLYDDSEYLPWDTSIVAASVVAQSLMTWKKRENWWFWTLPVNVSAIGLFIATRSWALVFLYLVFLANSVWGWFDWNRLEGRP